MAFYGPRKSIMNEDVDRGQYLFLGSKKLDIDLFYRQ